MKLHKILLASSAALACASFASAAVELKITGATAFRSSVHAAIVSSLNNVKVTYITTTTNGTATVSGAGTSAEINGASKAVFFGKTKTASGSGTAAIPAGTDVIVRVSWNGSAAGIQAVSQTAPSAQLVSFLSATSAVGDDVNVTISAAPQVATYGEATNSDAKLGNPQFAAALPTSNMQADVCFADVKQSSTIFASGTHTYDIGTGGFATNNATKTGTQNRTFALLSETPVGVVGFSWLRANSDDSAMNTLITNSLTNMDSMKAQALLANGSLPISFWTNDVGDVAKLVYISGRNADSGTRVTTFAETGFGALKLPYHNLFTVTGSGAAARITDVSTFPADVVQGVFFDVATSGESSGGTLVGKILNNISTSVTVEGVAVTDPIAAVTYASLADIIGKGAQSKMMSWNGVAYDTTSVAGDTAIRDGRYTFWGYEQMGYVSTFSGQPKTLATIIQSDVIATKAELSGVNLSTMNVERPLIGAPVTSKL